MDILDAAYNVVHDYPGGPDSLGPRVGKNPVTLSHEVRQTGGAKLGLHTAEKLTQRTGDLRILQAFAANCGQMLVALPVLPEGVADDCMERLAVSAREFGELCTEVATDLADGVISDNELARIEKASGELVASVHALGVALAKRNQAGKPGLVFPRVAQP